MTHLKIDYVELGSRNIGATQGFLAKAFGWTFVDYGPGYQAFANAGLDGGIFQAEGEPPAPPLVILKTEDLEAALTAVTSAGAEIVNPIFAFPGGRRFHFREPGGNEMAVWSER
jgi:predicted enzyme related to lactoylglutathione lyase